jgi:hypothetical protein
MFSGWQMALAQSSNGNSSGANPPPHQVWPQQAVPGNGGGSASSTGSAGMASSGSEQIYGAKLMNSEEKQNYLARLNAAKNDDERNHIRKMHREMMDQRARERGMTLDGTDESTSQ